MSFYAYFNFCGVVAAENVSLVSLEVRPGSLSYLFRLFLLKFARAKKHPQTPPARIAAFKPYSAGARADACIAASLSAPVDAASTRQCSHERAARGRPVARRSCCFNASLLT